jgi:hypothetical protein
MPLPDMVDIGCIAEEDVAVAEDGNMLVDTGILIVPLDMGISMDIDMDMITMLLQSDPAERMWWKWW